MQKDRMWDYLIITAANSRQARSYELQLRERKHNEYLHRVRHCFVVPDIDGKRIGSGGSTLHCLTQVLELECHGERFHTFDEAEAILQELRILIVHAGGDSRRLPPYSHCGKMFVPLPHAELCGTGATLFDRLIPEFLQLDAGPRGQVVIASGDALILFDPSTVDLSQPGITALGWLAPAQEGAHHGVFCAGEDGLVTRYLQKLAPDDQLRAGAVNSAGHSVLDLGVMSCDAASAVQLMRAFFFERSNPLERKLDWKQESREILLSAGIDLYREICCALGTGTSLAQYMESLRAGGSCVDDAVTSEWFRSLHRIPLQVRILRDAKFLHFGTTRQLITSGVALLEEDSAKPASALLILNCAIQGEVRGDHAWIEASSIHATLRLEGLNVVVGADIEEPLSLSRGDCFDISIGMGRDGHTVCFLRCYDIDDSFKHSIGAGGTFCGVQLGRWMEQMGARVSDLWSDEISPHERTLWNARVFPALKQRREFLEWLWLFKVGSVTAEQKARFWACDRYSSSEIAIRVEPSQFYGRRAGMQSSTILPDAAVAYPIANFVPER